jgi:hypothetical protein
VTPSAEAGAVELWFLLGGAWQEPVRFALPAGADAGRSMDQRLREAVAALPAGGPPNPGHLAILIRWYGSSWRDGEWLGFESREQAPYRKLVNAISRVAAHRPERGAR